MAHDYLGVKLEIVWDIATIDMPILKKFAEEIIEQYKDNDSEQADDADFDL
jgi:uncharacterized protein with HEPN domain